MIGTSCFVYFFRLRKPAKALFRRITGGIVCLPQIAQSSPSAGEAAIAIRT